MVQERYRSKTPFTKKLFGFLLLNILPIGALGWFVWALSTDRVSLDDLPEGLDRNAAYLGIALSLLFVVVTFVLPFVHFCTARLLEGLLWSAEVRSHAGFLRVVLELLLWPFRQILYRLLWVLRFALYLVSLALIAVSIAFIVRLVRPDFLEERVPIGEWMMKGETWLRDRW